MLTQDSITVNGVAFSFEGDTRIATINGVRVALLFETQLGDELPSLFDCDCDNQDEFDAVAPQLFNAIRSMGYGIHPSLTFKPESTY